MWTDAMEKRGMRVSRKKTEYLRLDAVKTAHAGEARVNMQGEEVKRVDELKYLGSTVQEDGVSDREEARKIQAG